MIPQSFLQDLLNRVDIVDVVGRYVQLKKGGANFMGLCPFHNEKSPSFTVSPTKQFYHCFGCGAHGTAIGFLIEYSGLGFVDAVKSLAQDNGMVVPDDDDKIPPAQRAEQQAKALALSEVMTLAADYYRLQLRAAERAKEYLRGRGLTGEVAQRYGIGYAPDAWDGLRTVFPDYDQAVLVETGMVIDRSDEDDAHRKRYDRFRDRIMFPIRNVKGQTIGFGGRVLDRGEPKYLNSPETPLFQKGSELYGLFEARNAIRDAGYVLVTEGYMDVVALAQLGFPQAVATLGTASTAIHVQKLLRQTDQVIFSFDGDGAGRRAARRALEACLPYAGDNKVLKFLFLPTEHDPDSYVREFGAEAFEQQIRDAMPLSQFLLQVVSSEHDLSSPEGRARTQYDAKPLLQAMAPSGLRLQIVRGLAQLTQSAPAEIEALFELEAPVAMRRVTPARTNRAAPMGLGRQIMRIVVAHPALASELDATSISAIEQVGGDAAEMILFVVNNAREMGSNASFAAISEVLRATGSDYEALIAEIAAEPESEVDVVRLELAGALRQTKMKHIKSQLEALAARGLQQPGDADLYREFMQQQELLRREAQAESGLRTA